MTCEPTLGVVKTLFALSGNTCAYRGCEELLTDPKWPRVKARIAHICGERPGSTRYVSGMSNKARCAFENLILLCPNCHVLVDDLERDQHPAELLRAMKEAHESRSATKGAWADRKELNRVSRLLYLAVSKGPAPPTDDRTDPPATPGTPIDADDLRRRSRDLFGNQYSLLIAGVLPIMGSGFRATDIARYVAVPAPAVRRVMKKFEATGVVVRGPEHSWELTEAGRTLAEYANAAASSRPDAGESERSTR